MTAEKSYVLAVNGGSSSLKTALFGLDSCEKVLSAQVSGIGGKAGHLTIKNAEEVVHDLNGSYPDTQAAMDAIITWLKAHPEYPVAAIGHRLVQGGLEHREPELIDDKVVDALQALIHLAPNHLPSSLELIRQCGNAFPDRMQAACYDTSFHKDIPAHAKYFALPRAFREEGVIRYGFHGLSYEYITGLLEERKGGNRERLIIAHLGNGCSMSAVRHGKSIDTTMGMTPAGGLVMGTRSGDLDPGVLLYLLRRRAVSADDLEEMINKRSGLEALSGNGHDVKDLLERETRDEAAEEALAIFCYQARKFIGALAAALGGLDMLVFTGGIGENAAVIRSRILEGLGFMGIGIDEIRNRTGEEDISSADSTVKVLVLKTDEEIMIARHTIRLIS